MVHPSSHESKIVYFNFRAFITNIYRFHISHTDCGFTQRVNLRFLVSNDSYKVRA